MRGLKFRAWDKIENRMIKIESFFQIPSNWKDVWEIEQFTGIRDKNGVEIYEGDIVANKKRFENIPCHGRHDSAELVEMKEIAGSDDMGIDCVGYPDYWKGMYIIGNIHENQELLEATDDR